MENSKNLTLFPLLEIKLKRGESLNREQEVKKQSENTISCIKL